MNFSQTLARTSLLSSHFSIPSLPFRHGFQQNCRRIRCIPELSIPNSVAISEPLILEPSENLAEDTVEQLLAPQSNEIVSKMMKMERKSSCNANLQDNNGRWFPYLDKFKVNDIYLSSAEVLEAIDPLILEVRKEKFRNVVKNRSFSVCLVVEGLSDFGNVSAACRSADALGFQSVHVVSCDSSKRFRDNRHVSMGSEKWLDLEVWNSTRDCFNVLKSRGYRIATTHLGKDTVSIYDMDWSCPTAIVVGNENRGISEEALEFSDLHCSIPMNGMVDSFNVSVAAGILMHHAVFDRTSRMNVLAAMHKSSVVHRLRKYGSSTRHGLNPDFVDLEGQLTHEAPREDEKDLESGLVCQV